MDLTAENKEKLSAFVKLLGTHKLLEIPKNSTTIRINAEKIDSRNIDRFISELVRIPEFKEYRAFVDSFESSNMFLEYLKREVKQHLINEQRNAYKVDDGFLTFDFADLVPFVAVDKDNRVTFVNTVTKEIVDASFKNYEKFIPKGLQRPPLFGVIGFDPYNPEKLTKTTYKRQSVNMVNTYQLPAWQFDKKLNGTEIKEHSKLPSIIDKFFHALFPSEASREYVYDWLHFALVSRCETYLVLNGAKGVGKGILADHICKKLMGDRNWKQAPRSALESTFNAMLFETRMIVLDEIPINDSDKIAMLKKYINRDQSIEFKGVDVGATVETFNSFIIQSNSTSDIRIEWDDRRFSVMDIAETKLNEVWSKAEIDELVEAIDDVEVMRNFGYWLMYRVPKGDEFTIFKGNHFWKLCYTSLPEWSKCIVDEITSGMYDTVDDETLKMKYRETGSKFPFPKNAKVEDFIKSYRHQGRGSLGTFEKTDNGGWQVVVSDEFYRGRDSTGYTFIDAEDLI